MVRLKAGEIGDIFSVNVFQFQSGAVKSTIGELDTNAVLSFQFQSGAVKSQKCYKMPLVLKLFSIPKWCG